VRIFFTLALLFFCTKIFTGAVSLDARVVKDKIKGGRVSQTVACTFGGPAEQKAFQ
jgi:hypothetical protein